MLAFGIAMLSLRSAIALTSTRAILQALAAGVTATILMMTVIGVSSDVIANPWFTRMIPVKAFDWVVLIAMSVLTGGLVVTFVLDRNSFVGARAGLASGILGWFAVSCPLCNKVVLGLLGTSGTAAWFEPAQPFMGAVAVLLAAGALVVRIRMLLSASCPSPVTGPLMAAPEPDPGHQLKTT